MIKILIRRV